MTTIAFDGKTLAADGQITRGVSTVMTLGQQKIFKSVGVFDVISFAGDWEPVVEFLAWAVNPDIENPPAGDYTVIFVIDGVVMCSGMDTPFNEYVTVKKGEIDAWGSGSLIALGAMHSGKSARQAVNLACKLDVFTGGTVRSVRVVK